jgi:tRNA threonylcarbamoyladenosine biosynthesis protein TsaB
MKILAIDTSTASGSLALLDGERQVAEWTLSSALTHNRRLLICIDRLLGEAGWTVSELDGLASTLGPGSFTGIRIGLTTVKTLAWTLEKRFVGIPTLEALAAPLWLAALPVCALLDARKKELYCAFYRPRGHGRMELMGDFQVLSPQHVMRQVAQPTIFCGDGWLLYGKLFTESLGETVALGAPSPYHSIRAGFVAELARRRFEEGRDDDPMASLPLYVRPSEAELKHPHHVADAPIHPSSEADKDLKGTE